MNSTNSTGDSSGNGTLTLPPSLDLPPHLSAQKYFFVCTLTVAAWDVLVLTPRTWRLMRSRGWPLLKIIYYFLRLWVPFEFTVVGVAFFDIAWTQERCSGFYLFEPICTAILLAVISFVHVYRIHAIYDKNRSVLHGMGGLFALQIVITAICCGFYRSTPLEEGQGCIAEPKHNWVGIYWVSVTLVYTASLVLAVKRSIRSYKAKPLNLWKLMLRDGLNLYFAVWLVNMVNMFFWFIIKPTGVSDPIRTIVTSMAAVLSSSMTMRIILAVRGPLTNGGRYAGSKVARSGGTVRSRMAPGAPTNPVLSISQVQPTPFNVPLGAENKTGEWALGGEDKSSVNDGEKGGIYPIDAAGIQEESKSDHGVKIQIDTETHLNDEYPKEK
ncbi:uncharacterized protein LAESUDRAFT_719972 [Laetiporus sulphureus 93-53]|uniref:Transmembrane protein n=1 Tax=Laetiporus sulphureus 93-53 TaxID=1314785 RepID=A0A165HPJ4_9APHY|nr:uncharacterized protein LAESUDRAFT_719972 [Laetiporus sulphureus 93-53]KZT12011.1 hypothetical protein LAESUDRAFT_719972 [Laetiporus sulphureus 93-53]